MFASKSSNTKPKSLNFFPFGTLDRVGNRAEWFGRLAGIVASNSVEVSIETDAQGQNLEANTTKLKAFIEGVPSMLDEIFHYVETAFKGEKSVAELTQMYFLTAISIKSDGDTFWIVLEPNFDVPSMYDQFLRFTVVNKTVVWSNINNKS